MLEIRCEGLILGASLYVSKTKLQIDFVKKHGVFYQCTNTCQRVYIHMYAHKVFPYRRSELELSFDLPCSPKKTRNKLKIFVLFFALKV